MFLRAVPCALPCRASGRHRDGDGPECPRDGETCPSRGRGCPPKGRCHLIRGRNTASDHHTPIYHIKKDRVQEELAQIYERLEEMGRWGRDLRAALHAVCSRAVVHVAGAPKPVPRAFSQACRWGKVRASPAPASLAHDALPVLCWGVQFTPEMQKMSTKSLSGGWRMRVALACALFVQVGGREHDRAAGAVFSRWRVEGSPLMFA